MYVKNFLEFSFSSEKTTNDEIFDIIYTWFTLLDLCYHNYNNLNQMEKKNFCFLYLIYYQIIWIRPWLDDEYFSESKCWFLVFHNQIKIFEEKEKSLNSSHHFSYFFHCLFLFIFYRIFFVIVSVFRHSENKTWYAYQINSLDICNKASESSTIVWNILVSSHYKKAKFINVGKIKNN